MRSSLFVIPTLIVLSAACRIEAPRDNTSQVLGRIPPIEASGIVRPKRAAKETLEQFASKLRKITSSVGNTVSTSKEILAKSFRAKYARSVREIGAIPREQGEDVVKSLVAPDSKECGGVSCAKVFGIEEKEVSHVLNGLLTEVSTNEALLKTEAKPIRDVLVSSLLPENSFTHPEKPWEFIAQIYTATPTFMPSNFATPQGITPYKEALDLTNMNFIEAIEGYTGLYSDQFRKIEVATDADLLASGYRPEDIQEVRQQILLINQMLVKMPKINQPVFRGMADLKGDDLAVWIKYWREKRPLHLGPGQKPALTSTSWDLDVARRFAKSFRKPTEEVRFNVVLEIKNHNGVSIEEISSFPHEREVLIPSHQRFIIEQIAPLSNHPTQIIIRLRGIDPTQSALQRTRPISKAA